jgi:hypothetical protein
MESESRLKLEEALKLKRGAMVTAASSLATPALTDGKNYVLTRDAVPFISSLSQSGIPTDADFTIEDDNGREVRVSYCNFKRE